MLATTEQAMKKLGVILVAIVAVALLSPVSVLADTWDEPITVPGARFVILGSYQNQAVRDQETGLVWERSPGASADWLVDAHVACNVKIVGNRMGWRLPTIQELASLIDPTAPSGPKLPSGHPFTNVDASRSTLYWSATSHISSTAWVMSFHFPLVDVLPENGSARAWCVRGGQGVNPQ
jgi:Protein of unknown function (DUF1566)